MLSYLPSTDFRISDLGFLISLLLFAPLLVRTRRAWESSAKDPSRRVRYDWALIIPEGFLVESASRTDLRGDGPLLEDVDFFCFHTRNFVIPIPQSPNRSAHLQNQTVLPVMFFCEQSEVQLKAKGRTPSKKVKLTHFMKKLGLTLFALFGAFSAYAGTVHTSHGTVHTGGNGNYHGSYHGGHGYYAHGGHGGRYWHGGYYHGHYYSGGYYPYDSPFFGGFPVPIPIPVPGF
jgi:hypothetical protein